LKNFYKDFGPPPYDTYIHFAKQMITALDYLHRQKIVHKDIKCANILLTSKGVLKLTDYGCSKGFDQTIFLVNYESKGSKTQKGTSHWMAPESIVEGIYTRKTDVWSLGCTLL
jgi:serine/threonine protein kinase